MENCKVTLTRFSRCSFTGYEISDTSIGTDYEEYGLTTFYDCSFYRTTFRESSFDNVHMEGFKSAENAINFINGGIRDSTFSRASVLAPSLEKIKLVFYIQETIMENVSFIELDLSNSNFSTAKRFENIDFRDSCLQSVRLPEDLSSCKNLTFEQLLSADIDPESTLLPDYLKNRRDDLIKEYPQSKAT